MNPKVCDLITLKPEEQIVGILVLAIPFVLMFVFFGWIYKEEKRREQLRLQRNQEWKREIQNLRDAAKEVRKKIIMVDLGGKTPEEQMQIIELVREQLKDDC